MYNYNKYPEINSIRDNEIEEESESFQAKWCPNENLPEISSVELCRPPLVRQFYNGQLKMWLPWSLHSSQLGHRSGQVDEVKSSEGHDMDIRPHIYDPVMKQFLLFWGP